MTTQYLVTHKATRAVAPVRSASYQARGSKAQRVRSLSEDQGGGVGVINLALKGKACG